MLKLPEQIAALSVAPAYLPTALAVTVGDSVMAVFGARSTPLTVVAWGADGALRSRTYANVPFETWYEEVSRREAAGEADAFWDVTTRHEAGRPLQLAIIGHEIWLVREQGHARIDLATLALEPVARSAVRWLAPVGDEAIAIGPPGLSRCDRATLDGPIFRSLGGSSSSQWQVSGRAIALRPGLSLVAGVVARGTFIVIDVASSGKSSGGWHDVDLVALDLDSERETVRIRLPTLRGANLPRLAFASIGGELYLWRPGGLARLDAATLAEGEIIEPPRGIQLIGCGADHVLVLNQRARAVARIDCADGPLEGKTLAKAIADAFAKTRRISD